MSEDCIRIYQDGNPRTQLESCIHMINHKGCRACVMMHKEDMTGPNHGGVYWAVHEFLQELNSRNVLLSFTPSKDCMV